ncbi:MULTISPECIES: sugar phosphate isomerase/epimerase family protein [Yersiniaceae]|uniref:Sugar phosphate isomerase/epimerase n=1 Tax=Nissabacter archeti TaxID=1917880 RepID=A0ABS5JHX1_9GAMM|nr:MULTISPECIES: TIM barrel protein [Yersiniaceae]MBS0969451.1 sugar phosphate isomerase/epimerase [Nissabacter archeti]MDV5140234.1 TIM barrel protein [Chimaeribacter arupi]
MKPVAIGLVDWRLPVKGPDAVRLACQLGAESIQLDLGGPGRAPWLDSKARLRAMCDALAETGITPLAVSANVLNDIGITAGKGTPAAEQTQRVIRRALDAAATIGAHLVFLPSFRASAIDSAAAFARTADVLHWACSEAKARRLLLGTENVLCPEQLQRLINAVSSSELRVVLDTGNPLTAGISPCAVLQAAIPVLANQVHIKGVDDKNALSNNESVIVDTLNELYQRKFPVKALVLENDYRDDGIERLKADLLWLKNHVAKYWDAPDVNARPLTHVTPLF